MVAGISSALSETQPILWSTLQRCPPFYGREVRDRDRDRSDSPSQKVLPMTPASHLGNLTGFLDLDEAQAHVSIHSDRTVSPH